VPERLPAPLADEARRRMLECRLADLPDVDHTNPDARAELLRWARWMQGNFPVQGLRLDAAALVDPGYLAEHLAAAGLFALAEIFVDMSPGSAVYEVIAEYLRAGGSAAGGAPGSPTLSQLDYPFAEAARACLAPAPAQEADPAGRGCAAIADVRRAYAAMGADQSLMGRFVDNHDMPRFLALPGATLPALRAALALAFLSEGIPIMWQGTEAGLGASEWAGAFAADLGPREPLWEAGFDARRPLYPYIRGLNFLRARLALWDQPLAELFVGRRAYAFARGDALVVALGALGAGAGALPVAGLPPGREYCDALRSGYCFTTDAAGAAAIALAPGGEPLVMVAPALVPAADFFVPVEALEVWWEQGLVLSAAALAFALATGWAAAHFASAPALARGTHSLMRRATHGEVARAQRRLAASARRASVLSDAAAAEGGKSGKGRNGGASDGVDGESVGNSALAFEPSDRFESTGEEVQRHMRALILMRQPAGGAAAPAGDAEAGGAAPPPPAPPAPPAPPPPLMAAVLGAGGRRDTPLARYAAALAAQPDLVAHLALEWSAPHLGHAHDLKFGGLGVVVDMFVRFAPRDLAIVAPLWAPFYDQSTGVLLPGALGERAQRVGTVPAISAGARLDVDVWLLEAEAGGARADRAPGAPPPRVFYFALANYALFGRKARGEIYDFPSEAAQLAFFAALNQAAAFVLAHFGARRAQLHDYHAALAIHYLPEPARPRVLLVGHNADYNLEVPLGTRAREAAVYAAFNLPGDAEDRARCEHQGRFNILAALVAHLSRAQGGAGVVCVSPRYAARAGAKFSFFWRLRAGALRGTLNGMDEAERGGPPPADLNALLEEKAAAKAALQRRAGLLRGRERRIFVFMGRVTHQKGCDLIALAFPAILRRHPDAQLAVAGPVGDATGARAARLLAALAEAFPGRVHNLAGQYVRGAEKAELLLAADFFLCPSRFEPCGLADIEAGWLGALQVGHSTGGLSKMPGVYFEAPLDNVGALAARLEEAAAEALALPAAAVRSMTAAAVAAAFPPEAMIAAYDAHWAEIDAAAEGTTKRGAPALAPREAAFHEAAWLLNNTPYDPAAGAGARAPPWSAARAWWSNALLLAMYAALVRLPSLITLSWLDAARYSAAIAMPLPPFARGALADVSPVLLFCLASLTAPLWVALATLLPPRRYALGVALLTAALWLASAWAVLAPPAATAVFYVQAVCAFASVPLIALIFLDCDARVSVSQHGVPLAGAATAFDLLMLAVAFHGAVGEKTERWTFLPACVVFLVLSVWAAMWLAAPASLPPHFAHLRLRWRGVAALLARRRAWPLASAVNLLDTFAYSLVLGAVFAFDGWKTPEASAAYWAAPLAGAAWVAAATAALQTRAAHRAGLAPLYALAALPGVVAAQMACVVFGSPAVLLAGATALAFSVCRSVFVGVLMLHTLPSREALAAVTALQVVLGSAGIAAGVAVGWTLPHSTSADAAAWLGVTLGYEAARGAFVAGFLRAHRRENIATP
jgi:glycogen synthase